MKNLSQYLKYWYIFLISIVVCLGIAFVYVHFATPVYTISTTLLIQDDKKGDGILKETAFSDLNMFHTTKNVDNEIQILRSINLLKKVFETLSLQTNYAVGGFLSRKELYGDSLPVKVIVNSVKPAGYLEEKRIIILSGDSFKIVSDSEDDSQVYQFGQMVERPNYSIKVIKGPAFKLDESPIHITFNNINAMAKSYSDLKLDITTVVKDANTIELSINDPVQQRGLDILNTLVNFYNKDNIENKRRLALATIQFIDGRIKFLSDDLNSVEQNVEQFKQNNMVTDLNSDAEVNMQRSEDYKQELQKTEVQLSIVSAIENYFNKTNNQFTLVPSTLGLQDSTLPSLINKFNDLQEEYQRLLRNNEPNNPLVINIKDQLGVLRQNIQENLKNIKDGLLLSRNNLAENSTKFESKIKAVPVIERELLERNRQQGVKANLFSYLVQKREETALSLSATEPDAQVVDSPNVDPNPQSPKKALIFLYSVLLGGIIPIFIVHGKETLNKKINDISEIENLSNVRILGQLSHSKDKGALVIDKGSRTNISELFRYIRINLDKSTNIANRVIMVTSSMQGEGKTFTSLNLAATLAMSNKKVVLVEFDLRKPDLLKKLNLDYEHGVVDYLNSNTISIDEIIYPTNISPNLWAIGCGKLSFDPAEELSNPKLALFFENLKGIFDYIIVDTSPIGLVADAFSLEPYVDSTIYVVRYNYTKRRHLNTIEDILKNSKVKNPMIVLNDGKRENINSYGYASSKYAYGS